MILLADYEGLEAGFGLLFGLIIMTLALLLGVGGIETVIAHAALETLAHDCSGGPAILIGTIWREDGHLYNSAAVLDAGKITASTSHAVRIDLIHPSFR